MITREQIEAAGIKVTEDDMYPFGLRLTAPSGATVIAWSCFDIALKRMLTKDIGSDTDGQIRTLLGSSSIEIGSVRQYRRVSYEAHQRFKRRLGRIK